MTPVRFTAATPAALHLLESTHYNLAMQRVQAFEFNDQPWLPGVLHESITEILSRGVRWSGVFAGMAPVLRRVFERVGSQRVLDLCSGAGEPISVLLDTLAAQGGAQPEVLMSDLFPNRAALARVAARYPGRVSFSSAPVDATAVPAELSRPVRTFINALHHFPPALVRAILADAVRHRSAIVILESFPRHLPTAVRFLPALTAALLVNPLRAPRGRAGKAALTYLLPVIPAIGLFDFLISVARTHQRGELEALGRDLGADYDWEHGELAYPRGGRATFFCGVPRSRR